MPRPRFQNLSETKRLALIEAAAKEFSQLGYEQASLNHILEVAGMSKGAVYYYFDDKSDVFLTAVRYYANSMFTDFASHLFPIGADDFWSRLKDLYIEHMLLATMDEPWRYGVVRALVTLNLEARMKPEIQAAFDDIYQWVDRLIEQGQDMDVIRKDLPKSLLLSLLMGLDGAADSWFSEYGTTFPPSEQKAIVTHIADCIQALLAPVVP
jgi:AcrR family transcriptional regulator